MRGVISAAMVCALQQLNLLHTVDVVYGSSAGAINGAFLIARQTNWGIRIYYEDINNRKFINPWRALRFGSADRRSIADVRFPINEVLLKQQKLDFRRVVESPIPLRVIASSLDRLQAVVLKEFSSDSDLALALQASSTMPGVAGLPVRYKGEDYVDALLFERLPIHQPIKDKCTHLLVLQTAPRNRPVWERPMERWYIRRQIARYGPRLPDLYTRSLEDYRRSYATVAQLESQADTHPRIGIIAPTGHYRLPGPLETRKSLLVNSAAYAYQDALQAFGLRDPVAVETLSAFDRTGHYCALEDVRS